MNPRVLFVGPTRYELPLSRALARKWAAIGQVLDYRVLARGERSDGRFELHRDFYSRVPDRVRRAVRSFGPQAIVAEDPRTAALVLLGRPGLPVIAEVHGNWRHSTRLYGSRARRALSPVVDALDEHGVRRAHAVRALSPYTARLVEDVRRRPPEAVFPTYTDLAAFTERPLQPLPARPAALFVGVLEPYKNVDGLAAAWRRVAPDVPVAKLVVVGRGSRREAIDRLVADGLAEHYERLTPEDVSLLLDDATLLVLPSRNEGLGRVVIEAFARGRGVVASSAGGILDLVDEGEQGLLVDPEDTDALAGALQRVLTDRSLAQRLGARAHASFPKWNQTPEQFAQRLRALVDSVLD
jgi:glycosyltransferase involved in cell wall biosynthesis